MDGFLCNGASPNDQQLVVVERINSNGVDCDRARIRQFVGCFVTDDSFNKTII
jgi:hypothetical protein